MAVVEILEEWTNKQRVVIPQFTQSLNWSLDTCKRSLTALSHQHSSCYGSGPIPRSENLCAFLVSPETSVQVCSLLLSLSVVSQFLFNVKKQKNTCWSLFPGIIYVHQRRHWNDTRDVKRCSQGKTTCFMVQCVNALKSRSRNQSCYEATYHLPFSFFTSSLT